ncbi:hypothetical protein PYCCODRAFT_166211 [Trametes coccinea BRFM310]|uniref:Uncharacterized protein n=1 Tax=Trametes coccinea (strain BRFM310) TaxID=1353009 RepID=A0A1Y2IVL0_TRAC3|nr:hypothetical protein PYCCODRAFT_166211 [Trametes coccinea BRFM310]
MQLLSSTPFHQFSLLWSGRPRLLRCTRLPSASLAPVLLDCALFRPALYCALDDGRLPSVHLTRPLGLLGGPRPLVAVRHRLGRGLGPPVVASIQLLRPARPGLCGPQVALAWSLGCSSSVFPGSASDCLLGLGCGAAARLTRRPSKPPMSQQGLLATPSPTLSWARHVESDPPPTEAPTHGPTPGPSAAVLSFDRPSACPTIHTRWKAQGSVRLWFLTLLQSSFAMTVVGITGLTACRSIAGNTVRTAYVLVQLVRWRNLRVMCLAACTPLENTHTNKGHRYRPTYVKSAQCEPSVDHLCGRNTKAKRKKERRDAYETEA